MGLFDIFRPRFQIAIGDCASRRVSYSSRFPVNLSGSRADGQRVSLCRILRESRVFFVEALDPDVAVYLNGSRLDPDATLDLETSYGLSLGGHLIVFRLGRRTAELDEGFAAGLWDVAHRSDPADRQALADAELCRVALTRRFPEPEQQLAFPAGSDACVPLADLMATLPEAAQESEDRLNGHGSARPLPFYGIDAIGPLADRSQRACPCCWKAFSAGEALSIASHHALTGDTVLGPHVKRRFAPQRFNERGQALDDEGVVAVDLACPHCRGRLPPSFFSHEQLIFSLVGAPSSGKSYYLSVLLRLLPEVLIRHYEANLQDGDPTGNAQLNDMKNRLFSATTSEDAFISKTDFEGVMYERLHRNGKLVSLPRPFVYYLQPIREPRRHASLVFYDNAGEHFKPGVTLDDSPGALHVAASAGLLFLFDPATHPAFRERLNRKRDPQLRMPATDEQDTILAELGVRIKKMRGLESHERVDTPLAVVVGKLDLWRTLLPVNSLASSEDRPLSEDEIEANSRLTRALLAELCPTVVANAESVSKVVRYFPASPLGHSPKEIRGGPLAGKLAPNPRRLKPLLATVPALWALQQAAPELLRESAVDPSAV